MVATLWLAQTLLLFTVDGAGPVRFGVPLPARTLQRGLAVTGPGRPTLQWRPLQARPDPRSGRQWVEVAIGGDALAGGTNAGFRLRPGRQPATPRGAAGPVFELHEGSTAVGGARRTEQRWTYRDGAVDLRVRHLAEARGVTLDDEPLLAGEARTTDSAELEARWLRMHPHRSFWANAGVVPRMAHAATGYRRHLVTVGRQLTTLADARGRGDYARSGGVVTNLEFDTTLGFARLGLVEADPELLRRAAAAARHLVDVDLERRTGLPFRHGPEHRSSPPEPGHSWLQGLLLVSLLSADETGIAAAAGIARGLARRPPTPPERLGDDRARDYGWPLLELEAWNRFADDPACTRAADALAHHLFERWDARLGTFRFGEGVGKWSYTERAWITGGILVPALRAHLERKPNRRLARLLDKAQARLAAVVLQGRGGIPLRYRIRGGSIGPGLRMVNRAEGFMVLEGLSRSGLRKALGRKQVIAALEGCPLADDPDAATTFSIAARCTWVLQ